MNREKAKRYVEYVVDDSGNGREWGADQYAIVREKGREWNSREEWKYPSKLVGWRLGYKIPNTPTALVSDDYVFVVVHSYLDVELTNQEAEELARDYLCEIGFFKEGSFPADFIL